MGDKGLLSRQLEGHLHLNITTLVHGVDVLEGGGWGRLHHRVRVSCVGSFALRNFVAIGIKERLLCRTVTPVYPESWLCLKFKTLQKIENLPKPGYPRFFCHDIPEENR